jgi:hypothetical protein
MHAAHGAKEYDHKSNIISMKASRMQKNHDLSVKLAEESLSRNITSIMIKAHALDTAMSLSPSTVSNCCQLRKQTASC